MANFDIQDRAQEEEDKPLNPKERGLGRGLGALFGDEEVASTTAAPSDVEVEEPSSGPRRKLGIEQLYPCPTQPRKVFNETALKELSESINEYGLLEPILVRPDPEKPGMYEIVAGERRWRAAQKAQLHEVPVVIRELDDGAAFQISLVENLQRQDLNPIEEAFGYQRLTKEFGHTPERVGQLLGKSRSHVANMMRLLNLPESVQAMVEVGDISAGHARALIGCDRAFDIAMKVIKNKLSVRETEKLIAEQEGRPASLSSKSGKKAGFSQKDADTLSLENEVSNQLGMNVSIDMKDAHKGTMEIEFRNLDQLDDILQRLAQKPRY